MARRSPRSTPSLHPSPAPRQATGPRQQEGVACCRGQDILYRGAVVTFRSSHPGTPSLFKPRSPAGQPLPPHLPRSCVHTHSPSLGCSPALAPNSPAPRHPPVAAQPGVHGRVSRVPVWVPSLGSLTFLSAPGFSCFFLLVLGLLLSAPKSTGDFGDSDWGFSVDPDGRCV
jgi:hypothetical protein